jgi:hypothetical protein
VAPFGIASRGAASLDRPRRFPRLPALASCSAGMGVPASILATGKRLAVMTGAAYPCPPDESALGYGNFVVPPVKGAERVC